MRLTAVAVLFFSLLTTLLIPATPAMSQTSIGYTNPENLENLLEYRLPAWSYSTCSLNFGFNGSGSDERNRGEHRTANRFTSELGGGYSRTWVSEQKRIHFSGYTSGKYARSHSGLDQYERRQSNLDGQLRFNGNLNTYLNGSLFSIMANVRNQSGYRERIEDRRHDDIWSEDRSFRRSINSSAAVGLHWGRIRNVVPLLRAERISERIQALGRPGLSSGQIKEIAQVLATEYAYRSVFERSDRHFWKDVLAPMLDPNNPLTPFEVMYLSDVLNEDIGERMQGFEVGGAFRYTESSGMSSFDDDSGETEKSYRRNPELTLRWYHNLSLTRQIYCNGQIRFTGGKTSDRTIDSRILALEAGHLWNLADRYILNTSFNYREGNNFQDDVSSNYVGLNNSLEFYLEDRISLVSGIDGSYGWNKRQEEESIGWRWSYSMSLRYHIDRLFG